MVWTSLKNLKNRANDRYSGVSDEKQLIRDIVAEHVTENTSSMVLINHGINANLKKLNGEITKLSSSKSIATGNADEDEDEEKHGSHLTDANLLKMSDDLEKIEKINLDYRHYKVVKHDDMGNDVHSKSFEQLIAQSKDVVNKYIQFLESLVSKVGSQNIKNRWTTEGPTHGSVELLARARRIQDDFISIDAIKKVNTRSIEDKPKTSKIPSATPMSPQRAIPINSKHY